MSWLIYVSSQEYMKSLNATGKNYCMAHLTLGINMWRGLGQLDDGNL
jgi:hypothetical protein